METKRLFLALGISFIFFAVYSAIVAKYSPAPQSVKTTAEINSPSSTNNVLPQVANKPELSTQIQSPSQTENATIGNFIVTYAAKGGYLVKVELKNYNEVLLFESIGFDPEKKDTEYKVEIKNNQLIFSQGSDLRIYTFSGYVINLKTSFKPASPIMLFSNLLIVNGIDNQYDQAFYNEKEEIKRAQFKKLPGVVLNDVSYAGARDRFFTASLLPGNYSVQWKKDVLNLYLWLIPSDQKDISLYLGPQLEKELQLVGLQEVMNYGFFHIIGVFINKLLNGFYFITHSWGLSVIFLSLAIYLMLFPLTAKSTKAMKLMQDLQPEIEGLKLKYKENPHKMNQEIMELYKKNKINPLGGCLPLLLQFPIFIALYQVLMRFVELKGSSFFWIKDLSLPDHAFNLGAAIPFVGSYLNILPILLIVLGILQQKLTSQASMSNDQKGMAMFFAVFIGVIFYNFPSSLVIYWLIQNLMTFLYQYRATHLQKHS